MSPEILKRKEHNYKCDLWSIGIIIYRLIFGEFPYLGDEMELITQIEEKGNDEIKIKDEVLNNLVKRCLEREPEDRISWDDYFKHPFFEMRREEQNYKEYYEIKEVIGTGGYGCVYKGIDKKTNELRAIKVINIEKVEAELSSKYKAEEIKEHLELCIKGFKTEFENMKICSRNNNNSVKCYEYFYDQENFVIIMELCDKSLFQLFIERIRQNNRFNIEEVKDIMMQLNHTFEIMKENNIIHRDLKLENILIKFIDNKKKNI